LRPGECLLRSRILQNRVDKRDRGWDKGKEGPIKGEVGSSITHEFYAASWKNVFAKVHIGRDRSPPGVKGTKGETGA